MAIDPIKLAIMLAASLVCGVLLAIFYELFGIFSCFEALIRSRCEKNESNSAVKNIFIFFKDLSFCLIIGCVLILIIYFTNDGKFRIMAPIGMAIGGILGHKTLGGIIRYLISLLSRFLFKVLEVVLRPILFLVHKVEKIFIKLIFLIGQRIKTYLYMSKSADKLKNNRNGIKRKNEKKKFQGVSKKIEIIDNTTVGARSSYHSWNIH